jgi:hypothetical protein
MSDAEKASHHTDDFSAAEESDKCAPVFQTFRDRDCALWQSVVEEVVAKEKAKTSSAEHTYSAVAPAYRRNQLRSLRAVSAATRTAKENSRGLPSTGAEKTFGVAEPKAAKGVVADCSSMAYEIAKTWATSGKSKAEELIAKFKFSTCDPKWSECIEQYVAYFKLQHNNIRYRSGLDNILSVDLPGQATIGFIGDWGTGTPEAEALLQELATKSPDIVIHLGDIYYTGLKSEVSQWFLAVCGRVIPGVPVFSLSGNHDMYSGGEGYYWLVDQLKQKASYFCIRNSDWQFVAMDTGYNDFSPFSVSSAVTKLVNSEADWINRTVKDGAGQGRRTCLLSHHQPFSAFEDIGGGPTNEPLLNQLADSFSDVDLWLWGHEHRLDIYGEYRGVKRGRCLGCSAIPVFVQPDYFEPKYGAIPLLANPKTGSQVTLGRDDKVYKLAYAVMNLKGKNATVDYFETENVTPLFTDEI